MTEVLGLILILLINLGYIDPDHRVSSMASLASVVFVFILFRRLAGGVFVSTSAWGRVLAGLGFLQILILGRIVLLGGLVAFEIPDINFLYSQKRLEAYLCFYINSLFYDFFPKI